MGYSVMSLIIFVRIITAYNFFNVKQNNKISFEKACLRYYCNHGR